MHEIKSALFLKSSQGVKDCPTDKLREFAFIGRSNVGKSSLINMLVGKKDLAKTSSMPGKTKLINHFIINNQWYLVDLPGYGYARTSKTEREKYSKLIADYIKNREELFNLFVLIDSRIKPQISDLDFIEKLGMLQVPFSIIFTKSDKIKKPELEHNVEAFNNELLKSWEELPKWFVSSATEKLGKDEILAYISQMLKQPK